MSGHDTSWTLFLDRDGVLNEKIPGDYVRNINMLEILPGSLKALSTLSQLFSPIIVVTNQQGIGKGLMTTDDLNRIHEHFKRKIEQHNGRIDAFYFGEGLAAHKPYHRKPAPGMALEAKRDFPEIAFHRSVMIGDSPSDITFGQNLGMTTVLLVDQDQPPETDADYTVDNLHQFASELAPTIVKPAP